MRVGAAVAKAPVTHGRKSAVLCDTINDLRGRPHMSQYEPYSRLLKTG